MLPPRPPPRSPRPASASGSQVLLPSSPSRRLRIGAPVRLILSSLCLAGRPGKGAGWGGCLAMPLTEQVNRPSLGLSFLPCERKEWHHLGTQDTQAPRPL